LQAREKTKNTTLAKEKENEILYDAYQQSIESQQFANRNQRRQNRVRTHKPYAQSVLTFSTERLLDDIVVYPRLSLF